MRLPHRIRIVSVVVALACIGCAARTVERPATPTAAVPSLYETQRAITEYVDSGRYDADVARVAAAAEAWMVERAPKVTRPAIVLDIDETSLSNWRAYRLNAWARVLNGPCDLDHGPCGIRTWQKMHLATAIEPTRGLVARARELKVAVFFITGRPAELQASTEKNLREQGFTFDRVILPVKGSHPATAVDFKAPARKQLTDEGYTIVLSMGDQQSDLDGGFAERTFKLPNPVYFLP